MANHRWSQEDKFKAAMAYVICHDTVKAGAMIGIPDRTIREWTATDWWPDLIKEAKDMKQNELDATLTNIIHLATDGIINRMEKGDAYKNTKGDVMYKPVAARDLAWIAAIFTDKRAVMRGQATSIKKNITESDRLNDLADKFQEVTGKKPVSKETEKDVIH